MRSNSLPEIDKISVHANGEFPADTQYSRGIADFLEHFVLKET